MGHQKWPVVLECFTNNFSIPRIESGFVFILVTSYVNF